MSRANIKKFAAFREVYIEINWKELIMDFLLKNRSRRFTSSEIRDELLRNHKTKIASLPKEILISRISASLIHLEKQGAIKSYLTKEK